MPQDASEACSSSLLWRLGKNKRPCWQNMIQYWAGSVCSLGARESTAVCRQGCPAPYSGHVRDGLVQCNCGVTCSSGNSAHNLCSTQFGIHFTKCCQWIMTLPLQTVSWYLLMCFCHHVGWLGREDWVMPVLGLLDLSTMSMLMMVQWNIENHWAHAPCEPKEPLRIHQATVFCDE